jgi:hypothetical protein
MHDFCGCTECKTEALGLILKAVEKTAIAE